MSAHAHLSILSWMANPDAAPDDVRAAIRFVDSVPARLMDGIRRGRLTLGHNGVVLFQKARDNQALDAAHILGMSNPNAICLALIIRENEPSKTTQWPPDSTQTRRFRLPAHGGMHTIWQWSGHDVDRRARAEVELRLS